MFYITLHTSQQNTTIMSKFYVNLCFEFVIIINLAFYLKKNPNSKTLEIIFFCLAEMTRMAGLGPENGAVSTQQAAFVKKPKKKMFAFACAVIASLTSMLLGYGKFHF